MLKFLFLFSLFICNAKITIINFDLFEKIKSIKILNKEKFAVLTSKNFHLSNSQLNNIFQELDSKLDLKFSPEVFWVGNGLP